MKIFAALSVLFLGAQGHAACDLTFTKNNLCAHLEWKVGPQSPRESQLLLRFTDLTTGTAKATETTPRVEFFMPAMGHGTGSRQPKVETTGNLGEYLVKNIFLSMTGKWEARFFLTNAAGTTEKTVKDVEF